MAVTDILMTTYNGAQYLDTQLESLFSQGISDFRLIIRDDDSRDGTDSILTEWQRRYPDRIEITAGLPHTGQPGWNFLSLLQVSQADYIMYCDQDDVWMPHKIEKSLTAIRAAEQKHPDTPILLHTDLVVSDADLKPIAPSFMRYQNLDPSYQSLPRLTVQNNVTGCTVLMNRPLRDIMRVPPQPVLHDWWAALTAAAFGHIVYIGLPTVYYRQHSQNAIGAKDARSIAHAVERAKRIDAMRDAIARTYTTADLFAQTYADLLNSKQASFLAQYSALRNSSGLTRWRVLHKHRAFKKGILRAAAQILIG